VRNRGFSTVKSFWPGSGRVLDLAQRLRCFLGLSTSRSLARIESGKHGAPRARSNYKLQGKRTDTHRKPAESALLVE
jgi:hypothetical protein